jgi:hypothetical protein
VVSWPNGGLRQASPRLLGQWLELEAIAGHQQVHLVAFQAAQLIEITKAPAAGQGRVCVLPAGSITTVTA